MAMKRLLWLFVACVFGLSDGAWSCWAADAAAGVATAPAVAPAESAAAPVAATAEVPGYDFDIDNPLYATLTAFKSYKRPEVRNDRKIKLRVDGFRKDLETRAVVQSQPAPLVVVCLGLGAKRKDSMARLWEAHLDEAGCHVLVFDSVFRPSFNERSGHGVAGNLQVEAETVAKVINAFMHHPDINGRVTKVGLLGASYGGTLALNYNGLAKDGKIGPKPDRVLVFSAPVSMRTAAAHLDQFYDDEGGHRGFFDLLRLKFHSPAPGKPNPFTDSQIRAGIGYAFHEDVKDAIGSAKDAYCSRLPESPCGKNARVFTRYIEELAFPYWSAQGKVKSTDELWGYGELALALKACSANVQVVLATDDPLNDDAQLKQLEKDAPAGSLTLLPRGGHLGYIGTRWAKERIQQTFKN